MEFLEIKIELKGAQYLSKKNCECGYRKLFLHSLYKIYFTNNDFRQWSKDKINGLVVQSRRKRNL